MLDQALDHGGHEERMGDAVASDQVHHQRRVGLLHKHGMATLAERHHAIADAADVKQRHRHQIHAVLREVPRFPGDAAIVGMTFMGEHHPFRRARGAGGIEQQQRVVGGVRPGRIDVARCIAPRGMGCAQLDLAGTASNFTQQRQKIRNDQHRRRGSVSNDTRDLARRQPPVQGHHDRADLGAGEKQFERLGRRAIEDRHPVSRPDSIRHERVGNAAAPAIELGKAQQRGLVGEARRVGCFRSEAPQQIDKVLRHGQ